MAKIVGAKNPEFWPESKCPYFKLPNGALTCYGDEVLTTLNVLSVDDDNVTFSHEKLLKSLYLKFGKPGN